MRSLLELQREFGDELLGAGGAPRMAIYRGNAFGNWHGALAGAYPVVRRIVGEAFFEAMARDYARACPSASGDLNEYGSRLAQFVERHDGTRDLPYLPDVARLEWLVHRAFFAADPARFDLSRYAGLRGVRVAFTFGSSVASPDGGWFVDDLRVIDAR